MRKTISIILIITIITTIFPPRFVLAYDDTSKTTMEDTNVDYDTYKEDSESGASSVGGGSEKKSYNVGSSSQDSTIKILVKLFNTIPSTVRAFMTILTADDNATEINKLYGAEFSIQKVVFNKVGLFNINFFKTDPNAEELQQIIKDQVAKCYYVIRNLAIVATLIILIYTGIRMTMATIATEKARYKEMIINWVTGFVILMLLPYIMIAILQIGETLIELCENLMVRVCGNDVYELEETLISKGTESTEKGFSLIIPSIIYWMVVFYQLKFLWIYAKRLFNSAFLVVISPLVLVQYIFDKAGDGEASSFKIWMTEFSLNVLIQPFHAVLYMIFMSIALNIVEEAPILAVVFLASLSRGEKILANILRIKKSVTVGSMKDNVKAKELASKLGG